MGPEGQRGSVFRGKRRSNKIQESPFVQGRLGNPNGSILVGPEWQRGHAIRGKRCSTKIRVPKTVVVGSFVASAILPVSALSGGARGNSAAGRPRGCVGAQLQFSSAPWDCILRLRRGFLHHCFCAASGFCVAHHAADWIEFWYPAVKGPL